jgi:riboflavin biosynthesis pyrimidine reductase
MVSSFDGATAIDGRSGGLGNATDRAVLAEMRRQADVILVGAKTARDEQYGPPKRKELQIAVVSNSLELDWTSPLWTSGRSTVITSGAASEVPSSVPSIRTGSEVVDVEEAIRQLDANVVVCEGGPSLNAQLFGADLVSGMSSRISSGGPELARRYELVSALTDGDWLFLRYVRRG